jgi:serine phosphatase RsbU (regulator of sigma subunit)
MKKILVPSKLLLIVSFILGIITFFFDVLKYESSLSFSQWDYINEGLTLLVILFYYGYIRSKQAVSQTSITPNLKLFVKLLSGLYLWVMIFKYLTSPSYSTSTFPPNPDSFLSLVFSNTVSIGTIAFLTPMLIIIKNLIYYKQKSSTKIIIIFAFISSIISVFLAIIFQAPLAFEFSGNVLWVGIGTVVSLIAFVILGFHNTWITYLSRKEKYYYFFLSTLLVWVIILLADFAFKDSLAAHSIALAALANLAWYFLVIYSVFASITFLFHLPTARVFDRKMKEVNSLHRLGRIISTEYDQVKLVNIITEMTREVIESSHTWIELYDPQTDSLVVAAADNMGKGSLDSYNNPALQEIGLKIIENKEPITINNISKQNKYASIKKWKKEVGSLAAAPLIDATGQVLGIIFTTKTREFGFDPDDTNMLEAYANQAAIALENANLVKKSLEQERLERELQIARDVQLRLLPQKLPITDNLKIDTLTITAYEVGGDYYDFFPSGKDAFGLIIGDVSGKGTSAAFYMAETKGIIQSLAHNYQSPYDILVNTNKILFDSLDKKSFITLLVARINYKAHTLTFARAGHCPVIHYEAKTDSIHFLQPPGIAIGLDRTDLFENILQEQKIKFAQQDILAFYTDGLSEAMNSVGEEFGEQRIGNVIKQNCKLPVEELKDKVIDEILNFLKGQNLHDDLTMILIKH